VVQYVVEELARAGMKHILFITGPGKTTIENHFDRNNELIQILRETGKEDLLAELSFERGQIQYFYTRQHQQLGLGHAVACAQSFIDNKPFAVALGDSIIGINEKADILRRMNECFVQNDAEAVIAFEKVPQDKVHQYGVAKPKDGGDHFELTDVIEKPGIEEAPSNLAIAGRYIFSPSIFEALQQIQPGRGGELQLTDAIRLVIQDGGKVYGVRLRDDEIRYDVGTFESYFRVFVEFALADKKYGDSLRKYLVKHHNDHHS
jgi:UTP--glucose-1-phosphate uridylyltransferase